MPGAGLPIALLADRQTVGGYSKIATVASVDLPRLGRLLPGRTVRFTCDGCAKGLSARIVFVAPRPEFTPPVIYSREARDRLVYLVEARPSTRLNPGQPVDVEPLK